MTTPTRHSTCSGSCRPAATDPISAPMHGHRPADFGYLRDIAVAADRLGFGGVLLPTGNNCLDGWITGAALAPADANG